MQRGFSWKQLYSSHNGHGPGTGCELHLRLDAVVGCGFGLAREKAASAIRAGKVAVNGLECLKPDKSAEAGDRISLRGLGKMELSEVGGLSRKGRTQIVIKRFI